MGEDTLFYAKLVRPISLFEKRLTVTECGITLLLARLDPRFYKLTSFFGRENLVVLKRVSGILSGAGEYGF
jgi:hypothetical protein